MTNLAYAPLELKGDDDADQDNLVGKALADLTTNVDARLKAVETKSADASKLADRLDKLETRLNRPSVETKGANDNDAEIETKAFSAFLRGGIHSLNEIERKTLAITSPSSGGIIAPPTVSNDVIQKLTEFSPVRSLASVISMNGPLLQMPRLVDVVVPGSVTELGTVSEDEPSFEQIDLKPFAMAVIVPVSRVLLEDSAINLNSFLTDHLVRRFGKLEASWFVTGNGTTQAEGALTSAEVKVHTSTNDEIDADTIIDTFYSIASTYSARGSWMMNRDTMARVRKLKDLDGQYLWQPALSAGQPPLLMGRPVYEAVDMPNAAAASTPILFGDFATGYLIADRINLEIESDHVTGWANGIVKVLARRRVGGRVILGEALTKLKLAAS